MPTHNSDTLTRSQHHRVMQEHVDWALDLIITYHSILSVFCIAQYTLHSFYGLLKFLSTSLQDTFLPFLLLFAFSLEPDFWLQHESLFGSGCQHDFRDLDPRTTTTRWPHQRPGLLSQSWGLASLWLKKRVDHQVAKMHKYHNND